MSTHSQVSLLLTYYGSYVNTINIRPVGRRSWEVTEYLCYCGRLGKGRGSFRGTYSGGVFKALRTPVLPCARGGLCSLTERMVHDRAALAKIRTGLSLSVGGKDGGRPKQFAVMNL